MQFSLATVYFNVLFAAVTPVFLFTSIPKAAFVYSVIYSILTVIGTVPFVVIALRPSKVAMSMAVRPDKNGRGAIDPSVWDNYVERYENRNKIKTSGIVRINNIASFATIIMFMLAKIYPVVCLIVFSIIMGKIATWRLYKTIKDNKTTWGAAAFLFELQELFGQKENK